MSSDSIAPAPEPRRSARFAHSATSSRNTSPSRVADASASVAGSTLKSDKDTSAKAAGVVAAPDGGNKEHKEKPPGGVGGAHAADDTGEGGKGVSVGAAPTDHAVAVFKKAIVDGKKAGGLLTPFGSNIDAAFEKNPIISPIELAAAAWGSGGTSRLSKLMDDAAKAAVSGKAVLGFTPELVTEASDLNFFTQTDIGALVQSEVSIAIQPDAMNGNFTSNATVTGVVFSAQVQIDEVVLLVDVPADQQRGEQLENQPKADKKLLGLAFVARSKDGKSVRMAFRAKLNSHNMALVHVNVAKLSSAAKALLLSASPTSLQKLGLREEYNGGSALEVGANACQGLAAYSALLGVLFEFERSLQPLELGAGAALLFGWQKSYVCSVDFFKEITVLALDDQRIAVLQGIEGADEAAKLKTLVASLRAAAVEGTALPWPDGPVMRSFVERCAALMSHVEGEMGADVGCVTLLQAHYASLVASLADNVDRDEGALRSLSLLLRPYVNVGYTLIYMGSVTITFPYDVNTERPSAAVVTRPGHWFHAWSLDSKSPLYVATPQQIATADAHNFFRNHVAGRASVEGHRKSMNGTAADRVEGNSASTRTARKSAKKACASVGCSNAAPRKDDVCGPCKKAAPPAESALAAPTAAPAKTAPTVPAWFKPPGPTAAAAAHKLAEESAPKKAGLASSDKKEADPWVAVGAGGRAARGAHAQLPKVPAALQAAQDFVSAALQGASDEQISAALKHVAVAAGNGASLELAAFGGLCNGICASGSVCVGHSRSRCCFRLRGTLRPREHFRNATEAATFVARNRAHVSGAVQWLADRVIANGGKAIVWAEARQAMAQQRKAGDSYFAHVEAVVQSAADRPDLCVRARSHELAGEARVRVNKMPSATASRAGRNLSTSGGAGVHVSSGTPRAAPSQGAAPRAAVTPAASSSTRADSHSNFEHGSSPLSGTSAASDDPKSVSAAASSAASGVSSDSAKIDSLAAELQAQKAVLVQLVAAIDSFQRHLPASRAPSPVGGASRTAPPASPSSSGGGVGDGGDGGAGQSHQ